MFLGFFWVFTDRRQLVDFLHGGHAPFVCLSDNRRELQQHTCRLLKAVLALVQASSNALEAFVNAVRFERDSRRISLVVVDQVCEVRTGFQDCLQMGFMTFELTDQFLG